MIFDFIVWFYAEFYFILLQCIACHLIVYYGMAWYCISFGLIARYHTVMYRCYSAPANYRVVHLVILLLYDCTIVLALLHTCTIGLYCSLLQAMHFIVQSYYC